MSPTRDTIDLNCDMGESFGLYDLGSDAEMLDIVTSANIACGFHAGDPLVMRRTVEMAVAKGVAVGAHPGYPDLQGFGRRALKMMDDDLACSMLYQLGALSGFTRAAGVSLRHIKLHGALYNTAARKPAVAAAVMRAVASFDKDLIVVTLPGSALAGAAAQAGLTVAREGFADRAYDRDGHLVPRGQPGAVIQDPAVAATRAVRMISDGTVETITGEVIPLEIETLCIHGDTPEAPAIAHALRTQLEAHGIDVRPIAT